MCLEPFDSLSKGSTAEIGEKCQALYLGFNNLQQHLQLCSDIVLHDWFHA
jgi:hypothetical protein